MSHTGSPLLLHSLITGIFLLMDLLACAQAENRWWYFSNVAIDFNGPTPVVYETSAMDQMEGSSSISDADGQLLFYTDGVTVWNKNNAPMPNGEGLLGNRSTAQSALILPLPGPSGIYYVFTAPNMDGDHDVLHYSIVDMGLDNGFGAVTLKNIVLLEGVCEGLTATRHDNGLDHWVLVQRRTDLAIVSFQFSASGVDAVPVISPPIGSVGPEYHIGYLRVSPDGSRLCVTSIYHPSAFLLDYDNATGAASNTVAFTPFPGNGASGGYGVEFSPSSSRLYLQNMGPSRRLVQYDLLAGSMDAILASRYVVDSTGFSTTAWGGALQYAPDGRIYVNRRTGFFLSAINVPDGLGAACGYETYGIIITPGECQTGLPNHVPLPTTLLRVADHALPEATLMPNPADHQVELVLNDGYSGARMEVRDLSGRLLMHSIIAGQRYVLHVGHLATGRYVVRVSDTDRSWTQALMIQH